MLNKTIENIILHNYYADWSDCEVGGAIDEIIKLIDDKKVLISLDDPLKYFENLDEYTFNEFTSFAFNMWEIKDYIDDSWDMEFRKQLLLTAYIVRKNK